MKGGLELAKRKIEELFGKIHGKLVDLLRAKPKTTTGTAQVDARTSPIVAPI